MSIFSGKFQKTVFIVSSGRTGTKALAHHLQKCYENVCAMHEPTPSWRLRRASNKALAGKLSRDELIAYLAQMRRGLVSRIRTPFYIESNPFLTGFIEVFKEVFEDPLILHVVRDPRTFVRSTINWGSFTGIKLLAGTIVPYWLPKPEHRDGQVEKTWSQMSKVEQVAWYWKIVNVELDRGPAIYGDHYRRVKFEDLFARDGSGLKQFTDWIALPWKPELAKSANSENVNASHAKRCPSYKDWPAEWKNDLLCHCRELMLTYGYDPDGNPASSKPQKQDSAPACSK